MRYVITAEVDLGDHSAEEVRQGIEARLHPVVACYPDEILSRSVTVEAQYGEPETDEYNGWANRETWAFVLHLNNDQGLQQWAHGVALDRIQQGSTLTRGVHVGRIGDALIDAFLELDDDGSDLIRMMRDDVGSTWRIDHLEVGRSFAEDVLEGSEEYRIEDSEIVRIDEDGDGDV